MQAEAAQPTPRAEWSRASRTHARAGAPDHRPPTRMGSGDPDPAGDPLASFLRHPGALSFSRRVAMARDATATATAVPALHPWVVDLLPLLVVLLIAAHVLALGYWIYRLATDGSRQPARSKKH